MRRHPGSQPARMGGPPARARCVHSEMSCLHGEFNDNTQISSLAQHPLFPPAQGWAAAPWFASPPSEGAASLSLSKHHRTAQRSPMSLLHDPTSCQRFLPIKPHCPEPGKDWEDVEQQPPGRRRCPHTTTTCPENNPWADAFSRNTLTYFYLGAARARTLVLS